MALHKHLQHLPHLPQLPHHPNTIPANAAASGVLKIKVRDSGNTYLSLSATSGVWTTGGGTEFESMWKLRGAGTHLGVSRTGEGASVVSGAQVSWILTAANTLQLVGTNLFLGKVGTSACLQSIGVVVEIESHCAADLGAMAM